MSLGMRFSIEISPAARDSANRISAGLPSLFRPRHGEYSVTPRQADRGSGGLIKLPRLFKA